ncbi:MlaD family protein [Gordonia sp. ABSL1-1]|uniref:MlaD family protein n=1 Tax=Gordonia sp. ABSL1-1 TaxID=3053923 RepID=UPI0025725EC3|nr:MlaD family protein [Gordonia sp. ABSL1-1]MDL9938892.1 MlaD family protein [Gordonia sp. ABSL1-1]
MPALLACLACVAVLTAFFVDGDDEQTSGCAEMADAVGLYPGNDVTMRGVKIGEVTSVSPSKGHVLVRFDLETKVDFPVDVSAVTTSDSIVTDRRLEIPSGRIGDGPAWDMARCIPLSRTHTPKSVSEAYAAFDKLSREVTAAAARSDTDRRIVGDAMTRLNTALRGTSGDFNDAIKGLAAALGEPALRDAQLRSLLTNVGELTGFFVQRWPDLRLGLTKLGEFAVTFDEWFSVLNPAVVETTALTPSLLRMIRTYSPDAFAVLDALLPLMTQLPTEKIVGILAAIPPLDAGLRRIMVQASAVRGLPVTPPRVRVSATASGAVCAQVNAAMPGACRPVAGAPGKVDLALLQMVLATGGTR